MAKIKRKYEKGQGFERGFGFTKVYYDSTIEPVFGQIKYNHGFDRFMLRGLSKTTVEWSLI
ncbi:transposase [Tepidibacillus decaturensis]